MAQLTRRSHSALRVDAVGEAMPLDTGCVPRMLWSLTLVRSSEEVENHSGRPPCTVER